MTNDINNLNPDSIDRLNEIELVEVNGIYYATSLNIARYTRKSHGNVVRDIEKLLIKLINRIKFDSVDYFVESTYTDTKGEKRKMYLLTRMGTAWLLNRYSGDSAVDFQLEYNERFRLMEQYVIETKDLLIKLNSETVASLQSEIKALQAKTKELEEASSYFRIRDYFNGNGINLAKEDCMMLGGMATKYCKTNNVTYKREYEGRLKFNTYPIRVLEMVLKQYNTATYNSLCMFT